MRELSAAAWELVARNPGAPRASYRSMLDWKEKWLDGGAFPYTPSIEDVLGTNLRAPGFPARLT